MSPILKKAHQEALFLLEKLVAYPSITPDGTQSQNFIAHYLQKNIQGLTLTQAKVHDTPNILLKNGVGPYFAFSGHTDVVPADATLWQHNPFMLTKTESQKLFGRGTVDMKGAIAAFSAAWVAFFRTHKSQHPIMMMLTGDEEGRAEHGTKKVVEHLKKNNMGLLCCLIGEPTSQNIIGDYARIARRGSFRAYIRLQGKQEHVAYATPKSNVAHQMAYLSYQLAQYDFQDGDSFFPPSSLQVTALNTGNDISNVTPSEAALLFSVRFSPKNTFESLQKKIEELVGSWIDVPFHIEFRLSAKPYTSKPGKLTKTFLSITEEQGIQSKLNASGGTSDGRFVREICDEILEVGLNHKTIHQANEHTTIQDLEALTTLYYQILNRYFQS